MRFSQKLGPRARRLAATGGGDRVVESVVEVARSANRRAVEQEIARAGGEIRSHARSSPFMHVAVQITHLNDLALVEDVLYVETSDFRAFAV